MTHHIGFIDILKGLADGNSLARVLMNNSLVDFYIEGLTVDLGGGRRSDYVNFLKKKGEFSVETFDINSESGKIDFEKDSLPKNTGEADTVLMFNLLEHIFNHAFLMNEVFRILKNGGTIVGFVPFLVQYHPDPKDYFRYTKDALREILFRAGFPASGINIKEVGMGPFSVNYNNLALSLPLMFRILLFPPYYLLDLLFLKIRPKAAERYPLGYVFSAKK